MVRYYDGKWWANWLSNTSNKKEGIAKRQVFVSFRVAQGAAYITALP
jgi:hypothetical protein